MRSRIGRTFAARNLALLAALLGAAIHPLAAKDAEPVVVAPSSQWQMDFGTERCRALRLFGSEKERTLLIIDQLYPRGMISWVIAGKSVDRMRVNNVRKGIGEWSVTFGDLTPALSGSRMTKGTLKGFGAAVFGEGFTGPFNAQDRGSSPSMPSGSFAFLADQATGAKIEWVEISDGKQKRRLATGNLGELMKLMQQCSDGIVKVWGLDPAVQSSLIRPVRVINMEDIHKSVRAIYPARAASTGQVANMTVRVMVDASGSATACAITEKSSASDFGNTACNQVMKVARFEPALDSAARPVASYWITNVHYVP